MCGPAPAGSVPQGGCALTRRLTPAQARVTDLLAHVGLRVKRCFQTSEVSETSEVYAPFHL